jgi:hypothetical protein
MESRLGIANLVEINLSRTIYTVFWTLHQIEAHFRHIPFMRRVFPAEGLLQYFFPALKEEDIL